MSSTAPWPLETSTRDRANKPPVLVNSANSGIGEGVAGRFAARRFRVHAVARRREGLERLVSRMLGVIEVVTTDVTAKHFAEPSVGAALNGFRRLDCPVNDAGVGRQTRTEFLCREALTCAREQFPQAPASFEK
jgi:NADP-dependent 3-hydroxy acid dehydrogenase YdfG